MSSFRVLRNAARVGAARPSVLATAAIKPSIRPRMAVRGYATETSPSGGSSKAVWIGAALVGAGAGYYFYTSSQPSSVTESSGQKAHPIPPTSGTEKTTLEKKGIDYQQVYNTIADMLEENEDYDDGSYGPVLVRLAWHSSGTYSAADGTGGSCGATMRFEPEATHGANNGLAVARDFLEKVKAKYPEISYGDLWTLAGICAIQEMGGPIIPWRPGRFDKTQEHVTPDGRLPDAAKDQRHVREIFYRMGFNDQEIVALLGAHAVGRCHTDRSGYEGPWTFAPTSFTNEYYKLLLDEKWVEKKWKGPKQYEDKKTHSLMMLPAEMTLAWDKEFKKWAQIYAKDQDKWFEDFSAAFSKLMELGVPYAADTKVYKFKPTTA
ncbi:hypothetical protein BZG36_05620 [Bifiguratus adelaidae]|uniref:Peroxidase n=1 Tax=Bifiguratus adelaidae TaxID=1938954 RepID=A0A261XSV4_9FUNG|nr:hypothetical protein BZG36_05620 [Bifiguratus adelaidae]